MSLAYKERAGRQSPAARGPCLRESQKVMMTFPPDLLTRSVLPESFSSS
jgi:hypothetical protein